MDYVFLSDIKLKGKGVVSSTSCLEETTPQGNCQIYL